MSDVKLCKNCKHNGNFWFSDGDCKHPKNMGLSFTNGKNISKLCNSSLRSMDYKCGPSGKWFEPKMKWYHFLKSGP